MLAAASARRTASHISAASCGTEFHMFWLEFFACCAAGSTTQPPANSMPNVSNTLRSNDTDEMPNATAARLTTNISFTCCRVVSAAECDMTTPLGTPVLPEVNMM